MRTQLGTSQIYNTDHVTEWCIMVQSHVLSTLYYNINSCTLHTNVILIFIAWDYSIPSKCQFTGLLRVLMSTICQTEMLLVGSLRLYYLLNLKSRVLPFLGWHPWILVDTLFSSVVSSILYILCWSLYRQWRNIIINNQPSGRTKQDVCVTAVCFLSPMNFMDY